MRSRRFWKMTPVARYHPFRLMPRRLFLLSVSILALLCGAHAVAANTTSSAITAESLIRESLAAATDGNSARRFALLHHAVRIEPDNSLAHWHLGRLKVDGEWLAVEEAQRRAAANPKQAKYRELRAEYGETPQGQLALARWCRKNDLTEEARFHWTSVISVDPNNREALRALDMRWHEGELVLRDRIADQKQASKQSQREARHWSKAIAEWRRALMRSDDTASTTILDEIREISDPAAIPAFEDLTLDDRESGAADNAPIQRLSLAFLSALDSMTDQAATHSLARYAVLSPVGEVRREAIDRLRYRPLHDFVPLLLDSLSAPVATMFQVAVSADGSIHYSHALYQEGSLADRLHQARKSTRILANQRQIATRLASQSDPGAAVTSASERVRATTRARTQAVRSLRQYQREAIVAEQQVAEANRIVSARNQRIVAVLANVTDRSFGAQPREWWDWWQDYNEYYRPEDRPVYETNVTDTEYIVPIVAQSECFVLGTPVWTKTGQRPIESLEMGDLVLSQDPDTGELAYKPIIGRTVRPPSPTVKLKFDEGELHTTLGHPIWVIGVGWRMAKQLEDGALLHAITGALPVASIENAEDAEAYNLVVADFNTYFVGEQGILVHDNTPRKSTRATVPGLERN